MNIVKRVSTKVNPPEIFFRKFWWVNPDCFFILFFII